MRYIVEICNIVAGEFFPASVFKTTKTFSLPDQALKNCSNPEDCAIFLLATPFSKLGPQ